MITRIAPSPSGYLHAGNAVNFLLTDWLAATEPGSRLHLRIDDMHLQSAPTRYLDDIFWAVDWLGIRVTDGPAGVADFRRHHSQQLRQADYRAAGRLLQHHPAAYVCRCSRTVVASRAPGTSDPCIEESLPLRTGQTALRWRPTAEGSGKTAAVTVLDTIGVTPAAVGESMGDFVVWRRDDLPAYQLASVVDDRDLGVDTIVRGEDLRTSTAAQLLIAEPLRANGFLTARFVHHPLLRDATGLKMSKRDNADALRTIAATAGGRRDVFAAARQVAQECGIPVGDDPHPGR